MKKFQAMTFKNVPVVIDVVCNKCGGTCRPHAHALNFEHAAVDVSWGYDSDKDCTHHHWDLCETCYDQVVAGFKVPPTVSDYMDGTSAAPFEECGLLRKIPSYPRISPDRASDESFVDFREDIEKGAERVGFRKGMNAAWPVFKRSDLQMLAEAVSAKYVTNPDRDSIPGDQREAWLDLDDRLTSLLNNKRPERRGGKGRPDEG